jgi:integrase
LKFTRRGYQFGSLRKIARERGGPVWEFRYRDKSLPGQPQKQKTFDTAEYPTETQARRAVEALLMQINSDHPIPIQITFGALVDRFICEERLLEIKSSRPGQMQGNELKFSTVCSYLSVLNQHIRPRWGKTPLAVIKPAHILDWLKQMDVAPKTKGHIKSLMHRLYEKAMLWELVEIQRNPLELVEIKGVSKRRKKPLILTPTQFWSIVERLYEPYRPMVIAAQCLGLRVSELLVLKWSDINFTERTMRVTRAVVHGRIDEVKTEYSEDDLPLDARFAEVLIDWRSRCLLTEGNWIFPNPSTGKPFHASPIQQDYVAPAGKHLGFGRNVGWHTFRHTYRSLLGASGAPMGVQQKLMRHAQIGTTMDVYGDAYMDNKRDANSKVVEMVLQRA